MRSPFSLYKKQTQQGLVWYARFWNEKAGKYTEYRSTGVTVSGKKGRQPKPDDLPTELIPLSVPTEIYLESLKKESL